MPPVITQQLELFASEVVPILRKGGLFGSDYQSKLQSGHFWFCLICLVVQLIRRRRTPQ